MKRRERTVRPALITGTLLLGLLVSSAHAQTTISFAFWGSEFEKRAMLQMVKDFEAVNPDIKVDAQHIPGDAVTKLNTLIAGNRMPDVFYYPETRAFELAEQGKLVDINDYYNQYPQLKERLPQVYYYYAPGKTFGTNTAVESVVLFVNKKLFRDANLPLPPTTAAKAYTWDQFVKTAQRLTIDQNGKHADEAGFDATRIKQYGVTFPTWWLGWYTFVAANGGSIVDANGKYALNSPAAIDAVQKLADLIHKYHVAPTPTQSQSLPAVNAAFQSGRVAMAIDGQWNLLDLLDAKADVGFGVLPKMRLGSKTLVLGGVTVVNKNSKNLEAAMKFYVYHNDPAKVDLFARGLWMPSEKRYYTDPKLLASWTDGRSPEYVDAVAKYALTNGLRAPTYTVRNLDEIFGLMGPLDLVWQGKKSAKEVLNDLAKLVQPKLQGRWPAR